MLQKLNRFISDIAGLEKTLRLIQAVAQVAAVFSVGSTAVRLNTAKFQLALCKFPLSLMEQGYRNFKCRIHN